MPAVPHWPPVKIANVVFLHLILLQRFLLKKEIEAARQKKRNKIRNMIRKKIQHQIRYKIWHKIRNKNQRKIPNRNRGKIWNKMWHQIWHQIPNQARHKIWHKIQPMIRRKTRQKIRHKTWHKIRDKTWHKVRRKTRHKIWHNVRLKTRHKIWHKIRNKNQHKIWNRIRRNVWNKMWQQIRHHIWHQTPNQVRHKIWHKILRKIWSKTRYKIRHKIWQKVWLKIRYKIRHKIRSNIRRKIRPKTRHKIWHNIRPKIWHKIRLKTWQKIRRKTCRKIWNNNWLNIWPKTRHKIWNKIWHKNRHKIWQKKWHKIRHKIRHKIWQKNPHKTRNKITHKVRYKIQPKTRHKNWRKVLHKIRNTAGQKIRRNIRLKMWPKTRNKIWHSIRHKIWHKIQHKIPHKTWNTKRHKIWHNIRHKIWHMIRHKTQHKIWHKIRHKIRSKIWYKVPHKIRINKRLIIWPKTRHKILHKIWHKNRHKIWHKIWYKMRHEIWHKISPKTRNRIRHKVQHTIHQLLHTDERDVRRNTACKFFASSEYISHFHRHNFSCVDWKQAPEAAVGNCTRYGKYGALRCYGGINNLNQITDIKVRKVEEVIFCGWPKGDFDPISHLVHFPKIRSLTIEYSPMQELIYNFPELFYLQFINITYTNLSYLDQKAFKRLHILKVLDLRMNQLKHLESSLILSRTFERLYLSGNPWNCTKNFKWLLPPTKGNFVADREDILCADRKYRERKMMIVMHYKMVLRDECQSHPDLQNCTCLMHHIILKSHSPLYTVNCSGLQLDRFPTYLPPNTTMFFANDNQITDVMPLRNNEHYETVVDVHLDNNWIESIDVLEGGYWLKHFRLLSLRGNKLHKIPVYALDNALEDNSMANLLLLSQNPWQCTCKFAMRLRQMVRKYNEIIRDASNITCTFMQEGKVRRSPVLVIKRQDVCEVNNESRIKTIDMVNGALALAIIFVLSKLAYDYYHYKHYGRVPWIVMKMP